MFRAGNIAYFTRQMQRVRCYSRLATAHCRDNVITSVARSKMIYVATVMMQEWQRPRSGGIGNLLALLRAEKKNLVQFYPFMCASLKGECLSVRVRTCSGDMNAITTALSLKSETAVKVNYKYSCKDSYMLFVLKQKYIFGEAKSNQHYVC